MIPKENIEQIQVIQDPETERSNVISQHAVIEEFPVIQNPEIETSQNMVEPTNIEKTQLIEVSKAEGTQLTQKHWRNIF